MSQDIARSSRLSSPKSVINNEFKQTSNNQMKIET